jgi:hypothetical protein
MNAAIDGAALLFNHAGKLVPEQRGRLDHACMKSLFPNFQIGAARQSHFDAHQHVVIAEPRNIDSLDFQVFPAVQHGRVHVTVLFASHSCVITTLRVLSAGWAANANASAIRSSGKRSEIISRTGKRRSKTSAADSA